MKAKFSNLFVAQVIMDMFLHENCHQLFYTNDVYVLIDIIVRQLSGMNFVAVFFVQSSYSIRV